jgi:hypothetical protein
MTTPEVPGTTGSALLDHQLRQRADRLAYEKMTCFDCGTTFEADQADVATVGLVDGKTGYNEEDVPDSYAPICPACEDAAEEEYERGADLFSFDRYSDEILDRRNLDY